MKGGVYRMLTYKVSFFIVIILFCDTSLFHSIRSDWRTVFFRSMLKARKPEWLLPFYKDSLFSFLLFCFHSFHKDSLFSLQTVCFPDWMTVSFQSFHPVCFPAFLKDCNLEILFSSFQNRFLSVRFPLHISIYPYCYLSWNPGQINVEKQPLSRCVLKCPRLSSFVL